MKRFILVLFLVSALTVNPVFAQAENPYVIGSTRPVSTELKGYINAWLILDAPNDAPYYFITNVTDKGLYSIVSLVGVYLESPESEWTFEDENTIAWLGSVKVYLSGEVVPKSVTAGLPSKVLMRPSLAAGGGTEIAFPFAAGTSAQYGIRGVHGDGDYGTEGMLFVDLLSGDDFGSSATGPEVYASDAGEIDFVCDDGVSVAIRTYNSTTGDYFIYAHMVDNANLVDEHTFEQGEYIGTLKYGTFEGGSPSCGWAEQADNHYHNHWGFIPANGLYQASSCILNVASQSWQCGDKTVGIGGWLEGGGGYSATSTSNDTGTATSDPTFWDYMLSGAVGFVTRSTLDLLPSHEPFEFVYAIYNVFDLLFRITFVLVQSNLSLKWVVLVLLYVISLKILIYGLSLIPLFLRALKWLVPIA